MNRNFLALLIFLITCTLPLVAQVSVNTTGASPDNSAMLDVSSTSRGMLVPRMTTPQITSISMPAQGLLVYRTDYDPGFYYNAGTPGIPNWKIVGYNAGTFSQWTTAGNDVYYNSGEVGIGAPQSYGMLHITGRFDIPELVIDVNNFQTYPVMVVRDTLGAEMMRLHTDSPENVFIGLDAGADNDFIAGVQGYSNTFIGSEAGYFNSTGSSNTAVGNTALRLNTSGQGNTAIGIFALLNNDSGNHNTALGWGSLYNNKAGSRATAIGLNAMFNANNSTIPFMNYNVAVGYEALRGSTTPADNTGNNNTALGYQSMMSNSSGNSNTATGISTLKSNTAGYDNTATGDGALTLNTIGHSNAALGKSALYNNVDGTRNTAVGSYSLRYNSSGQSNTALGYLSLFTNVAGSQATAVGAYAMYNINNTSTPYTIYNVALGYEALKGSVDPSQNTGNYNTALGSQALYNNSTGNYNTAVGSGTLVFNASGSYNVTAGVNTMEYNSSGSYNTAVGANALNSNSGNNNTVLGYRAGFSHVANANLTAIGYQAGDSYAYGSWCTFLGGNTDANAAGYSNSMALGDAAQVTASNQVRIGDAGVTSIGGYAAWTNLSDERFKKNIRENVVGLDFIMDLRPVTYTMDVRGLNDFLGVPSDKIASIEQKEGICYSGFVAQEVEITARETGYNFSGIHPPENEHDFYKLSYADFVVPLVKAVQEQQQQIEQQQLMLEELKEKNLELESRLNAFEMKDQ